MFGSITQNEKKFSEEELIAEILKEKPWEGILYKITLFIRKNAVTLFTLCWFGPIGLGVPVLITLVTASMICDYYIKSNALDLTITDEEYINLFIKKKNIKGILIQSNKTIITIIMLIICLLLILFSINNLVENYIYVMDIVKNMINTYFDSNINQYVISSIINGVMLLFLIILISINSPLFTIYMHGIYEEKYFSTFAEYHFRPSVRIIINYIIFAIILVAIIIFNYLASRVNYQENITTLMNINLISALFMSYLFIFTVMRFVYFRAMFASSAYNTRSLKVNN